jgi:hypothetical protein
LRGAFNYNNARDFHDDGFPNGGLDCGGGCRAATSDDEQSGNHQQCQCYERSLHLLLLRTILETGYDTDNLGGLPKSTSPDRHFIEIRHITPFSNGITADADSDKNISL